MGACCQSSDVKEDNIRRMESISRRKTSILFEKFSKQSDYRKKYEFIQILGNGGFGKVRLYKDKKYPSLKYAIKTIKKDFFNKHSILSIIREVEIIRKLDHPNIVNYFETYEDEHYLRIVMEYVPGDNLLKIISQKTYKDFNESDICQILTVLVKTVQFLHNNQIIHRDLKPENILFSITGDYKSMKVIDFGLSIEKQEYDNCRVGSPYYMAPEMINGEFYYESDIWSIGVILYLMVTGHYAFYAKHKRKLFDKIKEGKYNNERLNEVSCSEELKDLIRKLLIVNHKKRLSIQGILEHPFFKLKTNIIKEHKLDSKIIDSLREFNNKNLFQKEILFLMARISKESEIHKLREAFEIIDKDKTGEIKYSEIPIIFQKIGIKPNEGEIDNIWNSLDFHQDGKINYTEFLAATISSIKFEKEEKLWSVFQYFDEDDDGFISGDSIINALKINNDLNIQEKELSNLLKGLSNSKFDFEEFKKIFFDDNYIDHKNDN